MGVRKWLALGQAVCFGGAAALFAAIGYGWPAALNGLAAGFYLGELLFRRAE